MIKPSIPVDEESRLEALRATDLLDTPPEERFDRVTRLARRLFGVSTALVSLVDADRQWFKSRQGLDVAETTREVSFCGHAILDENPLVVPDASADERFVDNPLVTQAPRIRFYAGQPVAAPNGCRVGTLCIIDQTPRNLSEDDLVLLKDLAALIEDELAAIRAGTIDSLTGLSNRRGFELLAEKSLQFCRRRGEPACVVFLDMDGFKAINDKLGHNAGDRALTEFGQLLLKTFRQSDVVARLGGDEFVVLLSGSRESDAQRTLRRLQENVRAHCTAAGLPYELRFSAGTIGCDAHESLSDLLNEADRRMYENKHKRRQARSESPDGVVAAPVR
jgi:diguanylate cyclase (GGDEF)-like protein